MNDSKVSVVMSVHNGEKHLDECIQSILNQTFREFDFIIINDCSTDCSLQIIQYYAKKDPRIALINNTLNLGLTKSLNIGIKKARGKYIARIDADDIALPERLEIQYDFLEKNHDVFLVGSGAYKIDEEGEIIGRHRPLIDIVEIKKNLSTQNCLYHPTIMFRNEGYMYREKFVYAQDYDFYLMLLSKDKKVSNLPDPLINYRINPDAISWSKNSKQKCFALKAKEFYHQRIKYEKDEYDEFNPDAILSIDVENSTNKLILKAEIEAKFKLNEFENVKNICKKYFKNHGFFNKMVVYYLLSFSGKQFVDSIRNIIFR
jgi:glycosyltransferase involved in cell wall biosynthesis